ncbi:hypothetical protein [Larkinella rosea]|uniref:DUF4595 domain-containing protein n=1 Tax=Larkinella rosea TaxID=2025312 RepID=A0A3P1BU74_9BACT|nr:hypothetical protein [Larkinella rosea]RRB04607.1 hypothetical protein EHT25_14085 [Larkinella rosea]
MNSLAKLTAVTLCLLPGLFACENQEITPDAPATEHSAPNPDWVPTDAAKPYFLTRLDAQTLTYYRGGKLWKLIKPSDQHSEFEYGPNWVSATLRKDQKRTQKQVFLLNDKGNAVESYLYSYDDQGVNTTLTAIHAYTYDATNKLTRINLKNTPNDRKLFFYDTNGDLIRVEVYNASNVKTAENTYSYELPGVARQVDQDPIHEYYGLSTQGNLLNIFGKMNKHLLRRYSFKSMYTNQVIDEKILHYTLNSNGYVVNYTQFDVEANVMLPGKVSYEYVVTP